MDDIPKYLHQVGKRHAERAMRMWMESGEMLRNGGGTPESVRSVMELNRRAMEACTSAMNTFRFLRDLPDEERALPPARKPLSVGE